MAIKHSHGAAAPHTGSGERQMINDNSPLASHAIINFAVSEGGSMLRPKRLRALADVFGLSKSLTEKWCRPFEGDYGTGKPSPLDRLDALMIAFYDYCPTAAVLIVEHVTAIYEEILNMHSPHVFGNHDLARELLETVQVLLDPENPDEGPASHAAIARAKSILDKALASRRGTQAPDRRMKFNPKVAAKLAMAKS